METISAATYTIKVSEDTFCDTRFPDNPNIPNDNKYLWGGWQKYGQTAKAHAFFKFDLSSIPPTEQIVSVRFYAYCNYAFGGDPNTDRADIHYCSDDNWSDSTLTWNNQPSYDATVLDSLYIPTADRWYSWDVTPVATMNSDNILTLVIDGNYEDGGGSATFWRDFEADEYSGTNEAYIVVETIPTAVPAPEFDSLVVALAILLTSPAFAYLIAKRRII